MERHRRRRGDGWIGRRRMGGGSDAAAGSSGGGDFAQACAGYASALCAKMQAARRRICRIAHGDMATCVTRRGLGCTEAATAPGSTLTPDLFTACTTQLGSASCDGFSLRNIAACAFAGTRNDGAACAVDWQCRNGRCKRDRDSGCGLCARLLPAGAECDQEDCAANLECSDARRCAMPSGPGMPCSEAQPCQSGTYCSTGMCATPAADEGAACQDRNSCLGQKGLYCDVAMRKCAATRLAQSGQTCGTEAGAAICSASSECRPMGAQLQCSTVPGMASRAASTGPAASFPRSALAASANPARRGLQLRAGTRPEAGACYPRRSNAAVTLLVPAIWPPKSTGGKGRPAPICARLDGRNRVES